MISFGRLLSLDTETICEVLIKNYLENGFIEEALSTLLYAFIPCPLKMLRMERYFSYFVTNTQTPTTDHLEVALATCTSVLWEMTNAAHKSGGEIEPLARIVHLFKEVLPPLIDWSTHLQSAEHVSSFCQVEL